MPGRAALKMFAWWGTEVECVAALARLERQGAIPPVSLTEAQPVEASKETATRLLRVHDLRAADSLHLAAAIVASEHQPSSLDFVSLNERLTAAARHASFSSLIFARWSCRMTIYIWWWSHVQIQYR